MAESYDAKQDFKADLNIEVELEGPEINAIECVKNPGHRDFIPFKDLTLEQLPNAHRSSETLDGIKTIGSRVVRLVVNKKRNGQDIREVGSGCVVKFDNKYLIQANNHIVKTDDEVKNCSVEFQYDSTDRTSVLTSRGVKLEWTCPYRDITNFKFYPVPDFLLQQEWMDDKLPSIVITYKYDEIVTEKTRLNPDSTPNIYFTGKDLNSPLIDTLYLSWPNGSKSYMKSSYFTFQPFPPIIQELTSIQIHIDEDDGNIRVIPGDVVKCSDEFIVKISESIFQDEVKKCKLVWNRDVIGCGTRLYFKHLESREFFSYLGGIDFDDYLESCSNGVWIFDFHPRSNDIKSLQNILDVSNNMCCIGHPHGGIKMVTFGQYLKKQLELFDTIGRSISEPNPFCQYKEVSCVNYTCKTCSGSGGSAVFSLNEEMLNLGIRFSHVMGRKEDGRNVRNGEPIENINTAWIPTPYS